MSTQFARAARTVNGALNRVGELLPGLSVVLIKLALLGLFFDYATEFAIALYKAGGWHGWAGLVFVAGLGLLCLVLILWAVGDVIREERTAAAAEAENPGTTVPPAAPITGSLWPFVGFAVLPVAVIAAAHFGFGHSFTSGLSKLTQDQISKLLAR